MCRPVGCARAHLLMRFFFSLNSVHVRSFTWRVIIFCSDKRDLIRSKCLNNLFDLIGLLVSNRCTLVCNKFIASIFSLSLYPVVDVNMHKCMHSVRIRFYGINRSSRVLWHLHMKKSVNAELVEWWLEQYVYCITHWCFFLLLERNTIQCYLIESTIKF